MTPQQAAARVREWNDFHQPGTAVSYRKDSGHHVPAITATPAALLGTNQAVIWLKGMPVCVPLDRVTAFALLQKV
jgi:hypothetical protein